MGKKVWVIACVYPAEVKDWLEYGSVIDSRNSVSLARITGRITFQVPQTGSFSRQHPTADSSIQVAVAASAPRKRAQLPTVRVPEILSYRPDGIPRQAEVGSIDRCFGGIRTAVPSGGGGFPGLVVTSPRFPGEAPTERPRAGVLRGETPGLGIRHDGASGNSSQPGAVR
jgi:hypothetical protein